MATLMYVANRRRGDGTAALQVASGTIKIGSSGVFTAAEAAQLQGSYFLTDPSAVGVAVTAGPPTVQVLTIMDWPGDTFYLTFGGQTTPALSSTASAVEVQAALVALSSIGAGNCTVTGNLGGPYTVTFTGTLAGSSQAAIVGSGADFSTTPDESHFPYPH